MNHPARNLCRIAGVLTSSALLAAVGWGCGDEESSTGLESTAGPEPAGREYAKDSVLVRFRSRPDSARLGQAGARVRGNIEDRNRDGVYDHFANLAGGRLALVRLDQGTDVDTAIRELARDPDVLYAERNYLVHALEVPDDPRFGELWGLENTGQLGGTAGADIDAVTAWDQTVGSSDVVVAVLDTGIDYTHEDLAENMWVNPGEIPDNGLDDDNNGYVDDVHGINVFDGSGDPFDDNMHGTHCAGTIGAVGDNGIGVAGVNWRVKLMAVKMLDSAGSGEWSGAITALNYVVGQKNAGVNVRVLSNSWGGSDFDQAFADAVDSAASAGMLVVAAAGNDSTDNDEVPFYPASIDHANVLTVAATDPNDSLAYFSNVGETSVDLAAPGVEVLSTMPGDEYGSLSGTSMATPHVAGAAALLLSANGTLSADELKDALMMSGDRLPVLEGRTVSGRRLNVAAALQAAGPPVPRFGLRSAPAQVVVQEETATYSIGLVSHLDFAGDVALDVTSEPPLDAAVTITPVVSVPGTATLTVATSQATAPGRYLLTITGRSGELVRVQTVSLRVRPFGLVDLAFPATDTPLFIPDGDERFGVTSSITVDTIMEIEDVRVDLDIAHDEKNELFISLTSARGTTIWLYQSDASGPDGIHQTFAISELAGEQAAGTWTLHVWDFQNFRVGQIEDWTLHVVGVPGPPTFGLAAAQTEQVIRQGESAAYDIDIESFGGFAGDVALSLTSDPPLVATATFAPASLAAPGTSTLTIAADCATEPGDYALTVVGSGSDGKVRRKNLSLQIRPFAVVESFDSADTPRDIPSGWPVGIVSAIEVGEDITIGRLSVELDITHPDTETLMVGIIGPDDRSVWLLEHEYSGSPDVHRTFTVPFWSGASAAGTWTLIVAAPWWFGDPGTLDGWKLHVEREPSECQ